MSSNLYNTLLLSDIITQAACTNCKKKLYGDSNKIEKEKLYYLDSDRKNKILIHRYLYYRKIFYYVLLGKFSYCILWNCDSWYMDQYYWLKQNVSKRLNKILDNSYISEQEKKFMY